MNIPKEGTACAKALSLERLSNEENVSFVMYAGSRPAPAKPSWIFMGPCQV